LGIISPIKISFRDYPQSERNVVEWKRPENIKFVRTVGVVDETLE